MLGCRLAARVLWGFHEGPISFLPTYKFALVPKVDQPFFGVAKEGCEAKAAELEVECFYVPPEVENATEQVSILRDLIQGEKYGKIDS